MLKFIVELLFPLGLMGCSEEDINTDDPIEGGD